MALFASISVCISLCTSLRILPADFPAGPELRMRLYALDTAGAETMMKNNTLLEEKLVDTFKGCSPTATAVKFEFTATVADTKIERQSGLIKCDITWTESSRTVTQEMVTGRTGVVGEKATFLLWVDQDDAMMKKSTFTFMPNQFPRIPGSNDRWKDFIVSSTAGIEKSDIVIGKIRHTGINFDRTVFQTDVFWWNKNEQIGRSHYDDVLLWGGEEVQIRKTTVAFDVTDATTTMPVTDDGWEALMANTAGVGGTDVSILKVVQTGLDMRKTSFGCDIYWVANSGRGSAPENNFATAAMMQDDVIMIRNTFFFLPHNFAKIPTNDDEWKDLISSSTAGIDEQDIIIKKVHHEGLDFSREIFITDVFWCNKQCERKQSEATEPAYYDEDPSWSGKEVHVTAAQFGVTDAATTMPTTDTEWEVLIKQLKHFSNDSHIDIVKIDQKGLNQRKTTFRCDVYWVWNSVTENSGGR